MTDESRRRDEPVDADRQDGEADPVATQVSPQRHEKTASDSPSRQRDPDTESADSAKRSQSR
ncbi:MAG: hypothetical protein ACRDO2_06750, partial [Nocardioidaceae bacterium]